MNLPGNCPAPLAIRNRRNTRSLVIQWTETDAHEISWIELRGSCPCAGCRANRLRGNISLVAEDIAITAIHHMGYGVQLVFSDGHDRGIFPWVYLAKKRC
ncbi:DUF971 domain-containing protein [Cellvibrio japonicus]|uniref:Gamma-butyrobetaine hydroxylase-like N-terminal domain-containing protein n=1 Tax=Cellvibrio japonicus (strain Ueda107) TaxID=498211 RepID=B3PJE8_CELJU|nr:DUF971 domain-containing protein [Cellvibrio japonicus]ACE83315.1 conserved hypothetical protein [Cellvibrio japonicus Ueda107]QEI12691.1 DUF971 domain-containing protein [Cellvibrio japonicus]QEI16265.1 DUF971 domain-containing protein [Cellvibrio japonicus]QEI19843.1 DUF971 domain-containing protein [Cellvibrio japonicus]